MRSACVLSMSRHTVGELGGQSAVLGDLSSCFPPEVGWVVPKAFSLLAGLLERLQGTGFWP